MIAQAKALLDSLAITFDFPILEFIRNYLTNPFLDKAMPYITLFGEWGAFWIAVALILVLIPKTRKTGWSMGAAMALGLIICNGILKTLIARDRPFLFYTVERMQQYTLPELKNWVPMAAEDIKWLVQSDLHRSFPSGHTICCFEAATVLMLRNKWAGIWKYRRPPRKFPGGRCFSGTGFHRYVPDRCWNSPRGQDRCP